MGNQKQKWTAKEEEALLDGVAKHGPRLPVSGRTSFKKPILPLSSSAILLVFFSYIVAELVGVSKVARPLLKERSYPDLIDERMMDTHDCHELFWMIRPAEKCLRRDPRKRLAMDTVVNSLTLILEGTTCGFILKHCSPSRSDSSYAMSDSPKSEGNMLSSPESQCEDESLYEESTHIDSMNQMSLRLLPSPPVKSTCTSTPSLSIEQDDFTFDDLTIDEKREISKVFGLFYTTMFF